jgi:type IV pilus assembly protein PilF
MYKQAKSYFKQALDIEPDFLVALHGISSIYIKQENYSQALRFLHYNLMQNPKAAILHSDLAKTYEALKKYRQAKKSWELVIKLAPRTSPLSKEAKERILQFTDF